MKETDRVICYNRVRALLAVALAACAAPPGAAAFPSTFGPVIGSALLCRSHLDNQYFYTYLESAFGPSYKHEGGAYWFKTDATLWGVAVSDVIVSDDSNPLVFIGAVADGAPDKLAEAVRASSGVKYAVQDATQFPLRVSVPGSTIAYFLTKSKIYCAKYKPLPPGP